ncbi:MAG: HD domain-containing phosphohydrolase [Desulfatibacillaceae bacterium]
MDPVIEKLNRIGIALSSETDLDRLLELIVTEARAFNAADAGSLYTLEDSRLIFRVAQNDTLDARSGQGSAFKPFPIPLDAKSIAGYVALTGDVLHIDDVYHLDRDCQYCFNRSFDEQNEYRTQSMLVVPMKEPEGSIIGVLQLINAMDGAAVQPFSTEYRTLTLSLASQAAVAIRNARLIKYIKGLFEALIKYSASAIDARSPHTAGHSRRVAAYALACAHQINEESDGPFAEVSLSDAELERLSYAAWLHDIGKIGVPENILDKRWRLPVGHEEVISARFSMAMAMETLRAGRDRGEAEAEARRQWLKEAGERVQKINVSSFLPDEDLEFLGELAQTTYTDLDGNEKPLLTDIEMGYLTVRKGNLTSEEYRTMQSHVEHTLNIVQNIPFTGHLESVPFIASAHHEMLNGSGYPRKLMAEDIPLEARILAMVDIFDALTAMDRPYRRAISPEKACGILQAEVDSGRLDPDVVQLFVERRVYDRVDRENG